MKVVKAVVGIAAPLVGYAVGFLVGGPLGGALGSALFAMGASAILAPKARGQEERQASETTLQLGEGPRQVLFGRAAVAGSL